LFLINIWKTATKPESHLRSLSVYWTHSLIAFTIFCLIFDTNQNFILFHAKPDMMGFNIVLIFQELKDMLFWFWNKQKIVNTKRFFDALNWTPGMLTALRRPAAREALAASQPADAKKMKVLTQERRTCHALLALSKTPSCDESPPSILLNFLFFQFRKKFTLKNFLTLKNSKLIFSHWIFPSEENSIVFCWI